MVTLYNPYGGGTFAPPVYESQKIGNVYYPTLPPATPGSSGVPAGWNVGGNGGFASVPAPRPSPVVQLPLGSGDIDHWRRSGPVVDLPRRSDGSYGFSDPSGMARWAGRLTRFARRNPWIRGLEFAFDLYRMMKPSEWTGFHDGLDGQRWQWSIPAGWVECTHNPLWAPGVVSGGPTKKFRDAGKNPGNMLNWSGANCGTWGGESQYRVALAGDWYAGIYTRLWDSWWNSWAPGANSVPWRTWKAPPGWSGKDLPVYAKSPVGVPAPGPVKPASVPFVIALAPVGFTIDPASRPIGVPSGFNGPLPWVLLPGNPNGTYNPPGTAPTPGTDGPPRPPRPPRPPENPHRPKPGVKERKRRWGGKMPLSYAKDILNTVTEGCDAIDALWQALPGDVKWTPGVPKTCDKKAADLWKNVDKVDWDLAIMNLLQMYAEDKLWGKYFQLSDKAAAGFGMPGWKLDQPITAAPQVPFRGI